MSVTTSITDPDSTAACAIGKSVTVGFGSTDPTCMKHILSSIPIHQRLIPRQIT
jgi:hypothetical protein